MFESANSILQSPDSLHAAPVSLEQSQFRILRSEAVERILNYTQQTPSEEYGIHPLGFLNIPLFESRSSRIRIHIWYKSMFSGTSPYKIHDHSYSSYSIILAGHLRNSIYHESVGLSDNRRGYLIARATPGKTDATLQITSNQVSLAPSAEMNLLAGSAYGLWRNVFHYAEPMSDFVATLYFHLRHPDSIGVSRVAVPPDVSDKGPRGRFQYGVLGKSEVRALEKAVVETLV